MRELFISFTPDYPILTFSSSTKRKAQGHFWSVMPLLHLNRQREALKELRKMMPITANDTSKCIDIFKFLADRPPHGYLQGYNWFTAFHVVAYKNMTSLLSEWNKNQESQK